MRPAPVALGLALLFGLLVGTVSGFGGPGYEIALVTGIVMPTVVAVAVAQEISNREIWGPSSSPFDALARGALVGAGAAAMTLAACLIHGLRRGFCDLLSGLEVVLLGPLMGLVLAGIWGWIAAEASAFVRQRRARSVARVALAVAGPLGCIIVSVLRYYTSPMIFAYDPFVGYFSGTIYDTVIEFGTLATYRLGSAATTVFIVIAALHLGRDERGRLRPKWLGRPGLFALGVSALLTSLAITASGPALGHWSTRTSIEEELGAKLDGDRCLVVYARSLDRDRVRLFADECEAHVKIDEAWWGARGPNKITAFLFSSEDQKARLMGASGTNIAKPWRAEVYVQEADFPHRVIGHELMHVIASSDSQGPFAIGGDWGGYLPNPGLIEGVAVAASPKEDDLSPMEWAKTMKDLKILPKLAALFQLGFVGENASMAYTVSGAFVGWLHDRYGADAVRGWYRGKTLREATGKTMAELEALWLAELDAIELPEAARIQGKAKFDRPGFFARRCPRRVDQCRDKAESLTSAGDKDAALEVIAEARSWEPDNPNLRLDEAFAYLVGEDRREGIAKLEAMEADESLPQFARDRAIEERADQALKAGDTQGALRRFKI